MSAGSAEVVIVGYGPVGQTLAGLLGSLGHAVTVCERHEQLYPTPRAGHFDHEIMRIFQSLGIAADVAEISSPARVYEFLDKDGTVVSRLPRDWPAPSGWDASFHFYQPELERLLDARARSFSTVEVRRGLPVTGVTPTPDGVSVHTEDGDLDARFVVGADGANSVVRSSCDIALDDLGFSADWLVVDVRIRDGHPVPDIPDTGQVCDPARPSHMARLAGPYLRWEFMLVEGDDPLELTRPAGIWQLLKPWLAEADGELIRNAVYRFQSKVAENFRAGPVLLAGDAAHLMPPFLGQGMCSGIRDAAMVAWQLDLVLRGVAEPELLTDYGSARRPHVLSYIRESMRVGEIVCETDPLRAERNLAAMTSVSAVPPPFQPRIGSGYRSGDPLAGQLSWQPRVRQVDGSPGRLDDRLGAGFQLLTTAPLQPDAAAVAADLGARIRLASAVVGDPPDADVADESGGFQAWLTGAGVDAVLVRPDFYVYGSAPSQDVTALLESVYPALHLS